MRKVSGIIAAAALVASVALVGPQQTPERQFPVQDLHTWVQFKKFVQLHTQPTP